jgi:hypothetical protein
MTAVPRAGDAAIAALLREAPVVSADELTKHVAEGGSR